MTSTEIAVAGNTTTDLTLRPDQLKFTPAQVAALNQLGLDGAPEGDLAVLFHQAKRTGLDVFAKQIYMIGRNAEAEVEEQNPETGNTRKVKRWVTKYTIQIGIDGYRLLTRRAADRNGDRLGMEGPLWCDDDGVWRDVWPADKTPTAAKFIVYRDGEPFPFVAHYSEYVQTNRSGEPNSMWKKMPRNQLAKCAEVGACRRAYPADFAGLVFNEAATIDIDEDGNVVGGERRAPDRGRGVNRLRDRAKAYREDRETDNIVDAETVDDPETSAAAVDSPGRGAAADPQDAPAPAPDSDVKQPAAETEPAPAPEQSSQDADYLEMSAANRAKGEQWLADLMKEAGVDGVDWTAVVSEIAAKRKGAEYRDINAPDDLTNRELKHVVDTLRRWKSSGKLYENASEALNAASLREAGMV